ncbi:hypothetical protein SAMN05216167_11248 [Spirosoma endophyticum]|uniref:Uncharacterized protein n=1 Tax=Spirosoma endophyticum TaxID=662367 RepID=A0A1I1Z8K6_9BACT|nr:hypothetical protein SAMN05216167_11248 [Spirosoma endophyticum]
MGGVFETNMFNNAQPQRIVNRAFNNSFTLSITISPIISYVGGHLLYESGRMDKAGLS